MTATAEKTADLFKRYKAKANHVLAYQYRGAPSQILTEHGTENVEDGDYVVQVGELKRHETIPPNKEKGIPGSTKEHSVPKLEVMKEQDFLALYE